MHINKTIPSRGYRFKFLFVFMIIEEIQAIAHTQKK